MLRREINLADAEAGWDDDRFKQILRERHDVRENPRRAARVGREVRRAFVESLVDVVRAREGSFILAVVRRETARRSAPPTTRCLLRVPFAPATVHD
jgi:hypothetical protein